MNNSKIIRDNFEEEKKEDRVSILQCQQGEFAKVVEAINRVESTDDWQELKKLVLDGIVVSLERQLKNEANKDDVNVPELYRLQGQLIWARKYSDLKQLSEFFRKQIDSIKLQLKTVAREQ